MVNSKSLDNLRPFKKGRSGNPGGLPKGNPRIGPSLVKFLSMPPRIFRNYKPRSVAEELAKRMIELAIDGRAGLALRAFKDWEWPSNDDFQCPAYEIRFGGYCSMSSKEAVLTG